MIPEEFGSKKGGTFQAELSMFRSFFRNRRACRNNSFKNYLYITEKGLPNTTGRTSAKSKGSDTQRHGYNENLTILDREPILSRSRSRIQWAGFSHEGHGTQMQKMHGHSKPQVFSCGHMDPAQPSNFCPSP